MSKVAIIGGHGIGDCLLALQCATILQQHAINPKIYMSARDEVYHALDFLFRPFFDIEQVDESVAADNHLLKDESFIKSLSTEFDEIYYVIPDLLFCNKYAFDFQKYHTSPQILRSIRLLPVSEAQINMVYLGLMTTTDGYMYNEPISLALSLAYNLPNHTIYFPIITKWADKDIKPIRVPDKGPGNLIIQVDPTMDEALSNLSTSCYFVGTDNGPSHIAYHASVPRLILDPQFNRLPWIARWREDYLESIPINASVDKITDIVKMNLALPQTTLIPRMVCFARGDTNWADLLWFKTC